mgnify:FL=1
MTRKEFVVQIVSDLKENPKAVLRGHGLKPTFLENLASREDILGKIASFAFSTTAAPKGKKALQKQNNMRVFAYKDFTEFNGKSRADVQSFMEGLDDEDMNKFTNKNNVLVILALPDSSDAGSTQDNISLGKSVMLNFDNAVKKEYKSPGGMYYVIMFGDSVIRPAEAKKAEAKAVMNEKKMKVVASPAKIKAQLIKKAKSKLAKVNSTDKRLRSKASLASAQLGEYGAYARQLGLSRDASPRQLTSADREFNKRTVAGSKVLKDARIDEHQRAINTLRMKNRILVQKMEDAQTAKQRADIRFAINKNKDRIEEFKARMGVYQNLDARTIKNKAKYLADVNAEIEANLASGQNITNSLNAALAKLPISTQQKQQIAQQVIEEVVNNEGDLQLTTQQDLQQAPVMQQVMQAPPKRRAPRKTKTIEEILQSPVEPFIAGDLTDDAFSDTFNAGNSPQFSKIDAIDKVLSIA